MIKVGIVGLGFIGPIHIENLRRLGNIDIIALAEKNKDLAESAAARLDIPKAYTEWQSLVNDPEVEVVHITCPNILHYPIARACIEAGKHIVCDKPLTLDSKEARELAVLANKKKIVNAVTFNWGFFPMVQEARVMIENGKIGKTNFIYGRYGQDWLSKTSDYNWRVEARYQGKSRAVADIGSHWIQMAQLVLNKRVISVFGDMSTFIPERKKPTVEIPTFSESKINNQDYETIQVDTEDYASIMLEFEDKVKGLLMVCQVCPGRKNRVEWEIGGSEKSLHWNSETCNDLWIGHRDRPNEVFLKDANLADAKTKEYIQYSPGCVEGYSETWKNIFAKIYNYIKTEGFKNSKVPDFPTFEEGYRIQLIVDSILKSAESKKWVNIEFDI
jgi:predicted dehydrogenase